MSFDESDSVEIHNAKAGGTVVLLCEHASNFIPESLNDLGLEETAKTSHIAWDPGAREVALNLAKALDAPLIAGRVSRLVYDCNRPPEEPSAMPARSETTDVPGNASLSDADKKARVEKIYVPFCNAVTSLLNERAKRGLETVLVTIHSFTPIYFGKPRVVEIGILHDSDTRIADTMLAKSDRLPHRDIQRNEPYGPNDGVTHSLKLHGIKNGLPNVMLEIRNDLIADKQSQAELAQEVLTLLHPALEQIGQGGHTHA